MGKKWNEIMLTKDGVDHCAIYPDPDGILSLPGVLTWVEQDRYRRKVYMVNNKSEAKETIKSIKDEKEDNVQDNL